MNTTAYTGETISGLTPGNTYRFKVTAVNAFGEGPLSTEILVVTALKPSQPDAPTVSTSGSNVVITWTVPNSNGSPILGYNIKLLNNLTGNFEEDESYCNGASTLSMITL